MTRLQLATADLAALWLWVDCEIWVTPATVRQWAARGKIASHGQRGTRGGCYDLEEVRTYALSVRTKVHQVAQLPAVPSH